MKNKLLIIDDEPDFGAMLKRHLGEEYEVAAFQDPEDAIRYLGENHADAVLTDLRMEKMTGMDVLGVVKSLSPGTDIVIMTAYATVETAVEAMRKGAYDYILKPFTLDELSLRLKKLFEKRGLVEENRNLREFIDTKYRPESIIGNSGAMERVRRFVERVSNMDAPVLITGESGTGKHHVARSIHFCGKRKERRFITVHCGTIPPGLFEGALFGYEDDALAQRGKGLYEEANGGTLALIGIEDLDVSLQAKLLGVFEEREMKRVRGADGIPLDVMIIATSSGDLGKLQEEGKFRRELYYRLSMFNLEITPLRERREDIPLLAEHFFAQYKNEFEKPYMRMSPETIKALRDYDWPGNVRELKNLFTKICLLEDVELITPMHVFKNLPGRPEGQAPLPAVGSLLVIEKKLIQDALRKAKGNRRTAAKLLNISYDTLRFRVKKFGIDPSSYKTMGFPRPGHSV